VSELQAPGCLTHVEYYDVSFEDDSFDKSLLRQGPLPQYIGRAGRPSFSVRWIKQHELLDLAQFVEQLFTG